MKSLKSKIMIPVVLLVALGFIIFSYIGYYNSKKSVINHYKELSKDKMDNLIVSTEQDLSKWKETVSFLTTLDCIKNFDHSKLNEYISSNSNYFSDFESILLTDLTGNYIDLKGKNGNISIRDYYNETLNGEISVSEPILSKASDNPVIAISAPILDEKGVVKGALVGTINLSLITKHINNLHINDIGYAFMIDSKGLMIAHPDDDIIFTYDHKINRDSTLVDVIEKMENGEEGTEFYYFNDEKKFISYKPLESMDWSIGICVVYSKMLVTLANLKKINTSISFLFILLISFLLYYLINTIIRPIDKLKNYMEKAANGDLSVQSDIDTNDEISALSDSFNTLINQNRTLLEKTIMHNKEQSIFFSNISHELKTPLNLIFSTNQLMAFYINSGDFSAHKFTDYSNVIKQNSYRLLRLVNNLIDITKIDSNFINLNLKNKNIVDVVENITLSTANHIQNQSKKIIFDTDIEEKIMAFDADMMERIMLNLISNAIKFTKEDDTIAVNIFDREESIIISVKDTGIGIPEDKQEYIFNRFAQVDSSLTRENEGSGIGLNLVKSLVEMHGGTISLKSKVDEGSEFIIELPVIKMNCNYNSCDDYNTPHNTNVEKIHIEFSDIYE